MEILRKFRWVIYPSVFILVFLFASYCTFPNTVVKEMAESAVVNAAVGMGPSDRGVPEVTMKDVSLWRLSGVQLSDLKLVWPAHNTSPPITVEIASAAGRVGIFSLLSGSQSVAINAELYEGDFSTNFKIRRKTGLGNFFASANKINLAKMTFLESILGAPFEGIVNLSADLNANSELSKDGTGSIKLNFDNLAFGPGSINLPAGGFVSSLTVPKLALGKLTADFALDKGVLDSKVFSLTGGDVEADIKMNIALGKRTENSRITGDGWFSVKREFVNNNETLKMLFDLIPELRAAQLGDGKVGFSVRGTLGRPQFKLERYMGMKDAKKDQVAEQKK